MTAGESSKRWPYRVACPCSGTDILTGVPEELLRRGIELCLYPDGPAALLGIGASPPAAVLVPTDVKAIDLLDFVHTVAEQVRIPILVGVASGDEAALLGYRALEEGARGLLPLPATAERLTAALAQLGLAAGMAALLHCGPVTLNPQSLRVAVDGKPVHLTPKEFEVLRYLMRESPRVVSIDEIRAHRTGPRPPTKATVRMAIVRTRQKLDAVHGGPTLLETVRGSGYRMSE